MAKQQVLGVALILVAVGLIGGAVVGPISTYQEVQSHETTQAEIVQSQMESATEEEEGETEVEYYPRIEYEYAVDGTSYTDNRVFHPTQVENEEGELRGKEFDDMKDAEEVVYRYQPETTATVYYDPDDPAVSYLEDPSRSLLGAAGMLALFGLFAGGGGVGGLLGIVSLDEE
ncbi:DUF3592 domain-containing protein [Natrinema ejinorense]|uniref:DUF3592 domain-containing protein n=1 Tax=Natrinema ejinorense TaxID=373386 RepID=A0A2A5QX04_9EURY|nr:DUF3592 domain-containing protein [Natrinema ejinorense]PCR91382.1 hypothetical protein CP557_13130 [Natrinema ejinorense]